LLRQELIVGRVVDTVAFITIEGHYEGRMRIEEVPKDSVLSPAGVRESYHICVITDVAGRIWLVPAGLRKLLELIQGSFKTSLPLLVNFGGPKPLGNYSFASIDALMVVPLLSSLIHSARDRSDLCLLSYYTSAYSRRGIG
jgi:hypothetical protein